MSGRTKRGYPFPGMDDADNVPADMKALAEAVDSDVSTAAQEAHHADTVVKSIGITRMETGVHTQPFHDQSRMLKLLFLTNRSVRHQWCWFPKLPCLQEHRQ